MIPRVPVSGAAVAAVSISKGTTWGGAVVAKCLVASHTFQTWRAATCMVSTLEIVPFKVQLVVGVL